MNYIDSIMVGTIAILLLSSMFTTVANQTTGQIGSTTPFYNEIAPTQPTGIANLDLSNTNGKNLTSNIIGEFSTSWVGQLLTAVTLDMSWDTENGTGVCTPTGTWTVGVFANNTAGTLVSTYGTGTLISLPRAGFNTVVGTSTRLSFSGSHVMGNGEIIGVTGTDTSASCRLLIAGVGLFCHTQACSDRVPAGTVWVDYYPHHCTAPLVATCQFNGAFVSGIFSGPSVLASSPGLPVILSLIPVVYGLIGVAILLELFPKRMGLL